MLILTAISPLLFAPQEITELTPLEVLTHEINVAEIDTDSSGKRLFSIDATGVVSSGARRSTRSAKRWRAPVRSTYRSGKTRPLGLVRARSLRSSPLILRAAR